MIGALKKTWNEINRYEVRDICTNLPHLIKAVVKNGWGYIECFFCHLQLTYETMFFIIYMIYLHPS